MGGYIGAKTGTLVASASDIRGDISATDTTPEITLKNTTETDADGTRSGKITFKGEQSGGEESVLAQIQGSHDGTADDEKGDLIFKTNDGNDALAPTERLRINSAGDVLVSSPDPSLTITNTTEEDSDGGRESTIVFKGEQSGGELSTLAEIEASHDGTADDEKGDLIFRTNDGSDGTSPTERVRIDSNGSILTATLGTDNVHLGEGAAASIASGGNENILIGKNAGTALTTGDRNVAIGHTAFDSATDQQDNVAVGHNSLSSITASGGTLCTAIGSKALESLTAGYHNTAVGYGSQDANTHGFRNVSMGRDSLGADTKGSYSTAIGDNTLSTQNFTSATNAYNVAVGADAGKSISTGVQNTLIGGLAGDALTVGNSNVAIGHSALGVNNNGSKCVAIGEISLRDMEASGGTSNDYYNTAVGYGAGAGITSGYYNTIMGGHSGNNVTTGISNVSIGYGNAFSSASMNAEIVMGTGVTGSGSSTVTFGSGAGKISNTFTSNATWSQSSDERLKTNIQDDTLGLSFINRLNPVTYKWKPSPEIDKSLPYYKEENERDTDVTMHGLVAQQVKTALDAEGVDTFAGWAEGLDGVQTISREMFISPLIKAIKELSAEVETLKTKVAALEAE